MSALYFKAVSSYAWENVLNWFTDADTTTQADNAPWCNGDSTYLGYDLTVATGETRHPEIRVDILAEATGTCDISGIYSYRAINGGTFSGSGFTNDGTINGGTFSGSGFCNSMGSIYEGTFTGSGFSNYSTIYGGTFTGSGFVNYGYYYTGWDGTGYDSNGYDVHGLYQTHTGWNGTYYFIDGVQTELPESGTGVWQGSYYAEGVLVGAVVGLDGIHLYFKPVVVNEFGFCFWTEPLNWFQDATAFVPALNAPWVDEVDYTYLGYDLTLATGATTPSAFAFNFASIGGGATGACDIGGLTIDAMINGGTFSGENLYLMGTIYNGLFTGSGFLNGMGWVSGGVFSGEGFHNQNTISGGTFTGSGFINDSGTITGGTYAPVAQISFSELVVNGLLMSINDLASLLPPDPGFVAGGGAYAPTVAVTGIPQASDILGTGLL